MKLCDVNVLIYAHRPDVTDEHFAYADWLKKLASGNEAFGLSETVLSGFIRIVTHRGSFSDPTSVSDAVAFCDELISRPQACVLRPGQRNWSIFTELCQEIPATGKLVADAWHAALAIEYDCTWISTDNDFARFKTLKWQHPLG